jgi:hypothetical protein
MGCFHPLTTTSTLIPFIAQRCRSFGTSTPKIAVSSCKLPFCAIPQHRDSPLHCRAEEWEVSMLRYNCANLFAPASHRQHAGSYGMHTEQRRCLSESDSVQWVQQGSSEPLGFTPRGICSLRPTLALTLPFRGLEVEHLRSVQPPLDGQTLRRSSCHKIVFGPAQDNDNAISD